MAWSELAELDAWITRSDAERAATAHALATALGPAFEPGAPRTDGTRFATVRHARTGAVFVAVPGGRYAMGLSESEHAELVALAPAYTRDAVARQASFARPVRTVTVRPFLCATTPLLASQARTLLDRWDGALRPEYHDPGAPVPCHLTRGEVARLLAATGLRLPAEAEWEYVAREGGRASWLGAAPTSAAPEDAPAAQALFEDPAPRETGAGVNAFGLWGLSFGEWVADAWHDSYAGAPADAAAWDPPPEPELARAGGATAWPWRDGLSYVLCHAGVRHQARLATAVWGVRFALDLP